MTNWKPKTVLAILVIGVVYSFGSFLIRMQTPEGQCEAANDTIEFFEECYNDSSCLIERHELYKFNKAKSRAAHYCPLAKEAQ